MNISALGGNPGSVKVNRASDSSANIKAAVKAESSSAQNSKVRQAAVAQKVPETASNSETTSVKAKPKANNNLQQANITREFISQKLLNKGPDANSSKVKANDSQPQPEKEQINFKKAEANAPEVKSNDGANKNEKIEI